MKIWLIIFAAAFALTVATVIALGGLSSPMPAQEIAVVFILWALVGWAVHGLARWLQARRSKTAGQDSEGRA